MSRTLEISPSRDQKHAGLTDIEICAMFYRDAVQQGCDDMQVADYTGVHRKYSLEEVRTFLIRHPGYQGLDGAKRSLEKFVYRNMRFKQHSSGILIAT